ncbi:alpha-amylase family protein [Haloarchaeobius sp. HRN-SO-5]|uniref:alpha-amylase family protein n=1 Tax=Haloarchaeobius sp. HRN-SO-5 TaxID=3446118 RepID=UPI003EBF5697
MEQDPWQENAVIYALDVETFADSDGDGVGDFPGLVDRLDYLNRLGVSVLWLLPFYPTPNRDNGYDVTDYYGVDPRLGTLGDFVDFVEEADDRGIRVLADLVVNHTSDQHPWFQESRTDPESPYRDYYVWAEEPPPPDSSRGTVFPGEVEDSRVWTYDSAAGAYYYHRFYPFQPDLNLSNPDVRDEIRQIMNFWLKLGVDGFRVDAATLMIQSKRPGAESVENSHELLRTLKRQALTQQQDAVFLAEADDDPSELRTYAGRDEMDLLLNFVLNAHLVAALATEEAAHLADGLERLPDLEAGNWANFLRNYDELNLGRLPSDLKEEVFEQFAPEPTMRIYGRGIRRRLAPMLDGDADRIKLAFSLLFSMPGTPLLLYGDEIGMGEQPKLPGRQAVRTPMQWSDEPNAGFSSTTEAALVAPLVSDEQFAPEQVNVASQLADPNSLLNWMQRLVSTRREHHEIGHGSCHVVAVDDPGVFVHRFDLEDRGLLCVHNLADEPSTVEIDAGLAPSDAMHEILGQAEFDRDEDGTVSVVLDGYGLGWFHVHESGLDDTS